MKFYEALGMLVESKMIEGCSEYSMTNENWNGIKTGKEMKVQVRHQQEDPTFEMMPFLEMIISTDINCKVLPWIPSFLDMFSDKWKVYKYDKETDKEELVND